VHRYAITADVHGRVGRLHAVLRDARRRGATAFIDLGDVGTDACYDLLREVHAQAVFGNYEVSRWHQLSAVNQEWVRALHPVLCRDDFVAAHAAPVLPAGLSTVDQILEHVLDQGARWSTLFPRLERDEDSRWLAFAELARLGKQLLFHGHSHRQVAWRIGPRGSMSRIADASFHVGAGERYIVGVGSVGQPEDGRDPRYVLYDQKEHAVSLCKVG
jgi:diadenosine tetraphosphatase ApaH/serine/threonine PP2A family protein phosphatase